MDTPKLLPRFKHFNYFYFALTGLSLLLFAFESIDPYLLGSVVRIGITVFLFLALMAYRKKWIFNVYRINILLLAISYVWWLKTDFIDAYSYINLEGLVFENVILIISILIFQVLPIILLTKILILTENSHLKPYFKNESYNPEMKEQTPQLFKLPINSESIEYLGLAPADLLTYLAFILAIVGHYIDNLLIVSLMYLFAILLSIYAIKIGSKQNPHFSKFMNFMKRYSYHITLMFIVLIMVFKFI